MLLQIVPAPMLVTGSKELVTAMYHLGIKGHAAGVYLVAETAEEASGFLIMERYRTVGMQRCVLIELRPEQAAILELHGSRQGELLIDRIATVGADEMIQQELLDIGIVGGKVVGIGSQQWQNGKQFLVIGHETGVAHIGLVTCTPLTVETCFLENADVFPGSIVLAI